MKDGVEPDADVARELEALRHLEAHERTFELALRQRIERAPDDEGAHRGLADLLRRGGRLGEAAAVYERLRDLGASEAAYMSALLRGRRLPTPVAREHLTPAPFRLIPDFLTAAERAALVRFARRHRDALAIRQDGVHEASLEKPPFARVYGAEIGVWFEPKVREAVARLEPAFEVDRESTVHLKPHLLAYLSESSFVRMHRDNNTVGAGAVFALNVVYPFFRAPRGFEGGDLLLYDTDLERSSGRLDRFTRISQPENSLLLFPAPFLHAVAPVRRLAGRSQGARHTLAALLGPAPGAA